MGIIGLGTDIIEVHRIEKAVNSRFLNRYFSDNEVDMFSLRNMRKEIIAGNFAVKESFVKAIGTGFSKIEPKEIETLRDFLGKPYITLYGKAKLIADDLGVTRVHVTISHCKEYATATVILE